MSSFNENRIFWLPETQRDIMMMRYGINGSAPQSTEDITKYMNDIGLNVDTWQVEEVIKEAEQMINAMDSDALKPFGDNNRSFLVNLYNDNRRDEELAMMRRGLIPIYSASAYVEVPDREPFFDLSFVVKNKTGLKNLQEIKLNNEDNKMFRILSVLDYDFVTSHTEGLFVGTMITWNQINQFLNEVESGTDLKEYLADYYKDVDIIKYPYLGLLFGYKDPDMQDADAEIQRDRLRKIKEMGRISAEIFEKLGKTVIYKMNTTDVSTMDIYDYIYLGEELARKVVIENPSKLAGEIEIINPMDDDVKPFQKLAINLDDLFKADYLQTQTQ